GAAVLPLTPDGAAAFDASQHLGPDVGNRGEHLGPVLADLISAPKAALGVGGRLVAVIGREASGQRVEVMIVGGLAQPLDEGRGTVTHLRCHLLSVPVVRS